MKLASGNRPDSAPSGRGLTHSNAKISAFKFNNINKNHSKNRSN